MVNKIKLVRVLAILIVICSFCLLCGCDAIQRGIEEGISAAEEAEQTETPTQTEQPEGDAEENAETKILHGELLDVTVNDNNVAVVKAKITPSYSNKATIDQNYYNVVDLIRNKGFDEYSEVQYWAVADMTDGSEQKVVSFTVPGEVVKMIADAEAFADNTLGEYVTDLWVHPSLNN